MNTKYKPSNKFYTPNTSAALACKQGVVVFDSNQTLARQFDTNNRGYYILLAGNRYYVKDIDIVFEEDPRNFFAELFTSFISKKLGLNCIDTKLFVDNSTKSVGIISPNFGDHELMADIGIHFENYKPKSVAQIVDAIKEYYLDKPQFVVDYTGIKNGLTDMSCLDFLLAQQDRHTSNIALKIVEASGKKQVTLAPMFDNADAFDDCDQMFALVPIAGKYGEAQRELMQTDQHYISFFEQFKSIMDSDVIDKTLAEFENIYGLGQLFKLAGKSQDYQQVIKLVKQCTANRLAFCSSFDSQLF